MVSTCSSDELGDADAVSVPQERPVTMDYVGVKPPELNVPLIELETNGGVVVDLYNESSLRAVVLDERGLTFKFLWRKSRELVVGFSAIRNLRVEQPSDWAPEESAQIEHLLIRPEGPWPGVVFKAGGLDFEFDCGQLCVGWGND
jgi:hypothetical protein